MKLYAAGFNAWGQLCFDGSTQTEPDDLFAFTCILDDEQIGHVRPTLTSTEVDTLHGTVTAGAPKEASEFVFVPGPSELACEALNGRVAVYSRTEGTMREYASAQAAADGAATFTASVPGVCQLVAYDTGFAARTDEGAVWTWGDARYPGCLGRDEGAGFGEPGRVAALDDLPTGPIVALAAGGHVLAAVTQGRDLYCWGQHVGALQGTPVLAELDASYEPYPVELIPEGATDSLDVAGVGVGAGHVAVLASDGCVYAVGSNANGQLGLGKAVQKTEASAWARVPGIPATGERVAAVYAGPRSTLIVTEASF